MSSAQNQPHPVAAAARGLGRDRRLMQALGAAVAAAGLVWVVFNHDDLTPITPTPPAADRPPDQANNGLPPVDLNPTTTAPPTTAAPTTTTATPTTAAPAATAPAGAHTSPEEAAQAWWSHRVTVDDEQVTVHQRDRRGRDTFRVMVSAANGHQVHTGLLRVVRVGGNFWRCEGLWTEAG